MLVLRLMLWNCLLSLPFLFSLGSLPFIYTASPPPPSVSLIYPLRVAHCLPLCSIPWNNPWEFWRMCCPGIRRGLGPEMSMPGSESYHWFMPEDERLSWALIETVYSEGLMECRLTRHRPIAMRITEIQSLLRPSVLPSVTLSSIIPLVRRLWK